jgi:hypothetical protein
MNNLVYIKYKSITWPILRRCFVENISWFDVIDCVAKIHGLVDSNKKPLRRKTMSLIKKEANGLLKIVLAHSNNKIIKGTVSLKQIKGLSKPMSGKTSCHAGVILMAIYNLLCKESGEESADFLKQLKKDINIIRNRELTGNDLMPFVVLGKGQAEELYNAIIRGDGYFGILGSNENKLATYYIKSIDKIKNRHVNNNVNINFIHMIDIIIANGEYQSFSQNQLIDLMDHLKE